MAAPGTRILPPDFSDEDLLTLLETARLALDQHRLFEQVAATLDVSEDYLHELANRLAEFMAAEDVLATGPRGTARPSRWYTRMSIDGNLLSDIAAACRLALRAAYHACDHPPQIVTQAARRGCGACRAVVALEAVRPRIEAARREFAVPPASGPSRGPRP